MQVDQLLGRRFVNALLSHGVVASLVRLIHHLSVSFSPLGELFS